ncbi:hypothetical protein N0V83_003787 [Neocucurbitaria cava]|uniref:Uncharacterized protein n=1 Tax=Neocucurbitaria cava TaxID=798079 RepID=A0A9W8YBL5_9PLEO|nr:hypothetical protein N0V83_003787 [Neocucurbitaria cava]
MQFKVMDDERISDDLAAWACFRLDRLQPGLRMLHLYDANGVISKGVLLVRIRKMLFLTGSRLLRQKALSDYGDDRPTKFLQRLRSEEKAPRRFYGG